MKFFKSIIIVVSVLYSITESAVSQEVINDKYLVSLIKLETDNKLNKEISSFFKKKCSKKINTLFQISKKISFINIDVFKSELKKHKNILPFDFNLLANKEKFQLKYNYQDFDNKFHELLPSGDEYLFVHFSKPIGNLLTIQVSDSDLSFLPLKFGRVMQILFLFNEKGFIKNIYTKTFLYN